MGVRWRDVDLAGGALHVERSYDPKAAIFIAPKSRAGRRLVATAGALRDALLDLRASIDEPDPDALVFGEADGRPFDDDATRSRAKQAWKEAELQPIGLHAARHTAASVMIAAGVNVKALSEFLGHSTITITLDRYGHLLPGSLDEATNPSRCVSRPNYGTNNRTRTNVPANPRFPAVLKTVEPHGSVSSNLTPAAS